MNVTVYYTDGQESTFEADTVETVNDIAFVDGIMQTNVDDVKVSA